MLMSFEKYMDEDMDFLKDIENSANYPSVFELICLLPLSGRTSLSDEVSSLIDDSVIESSV